MKQIEIWGDKERIRLSSMVASRPVAGISLRSDTWEGAGSVVMDGRDYPDVRWTLILEYAQEEK